MNRGLVGLETLVYGFKKVPYSQTEQTASCLFKYYRNAEIIVSKLVRFVAQYILITNNTDGRGSVN